MTFFALLFLCLIGFLLWPVIKLAYKLFTIKRQYQNIYNSARQAGARSSHRAQPEPRPEPRRKRFSRSDGEYIDFEELAVDADTERARQYRTVEYVRQEQVSDAEWEEIK